MASAILPSRNEPRSTDLMTNFSNNSNLNFTRLQSITSPNPNPNPNPNPSHFFIGNTSRDVLWKNRQHLPSSGAAFTGSSSNCAPVNSHGYRYITFRIGSYTRRELKELKKRLISDLERVRVLRHWVCSTSVPKKNYHPPQLELSTAPEVGLTGKECQKRAVGQKRTKPPPSLRDTKKQCGRVKNNAQRSKVVMRKCGQILAKLMRHKHGWVFNTPVDAAAMKLYDYHSIINNPMDLGTIKSKLAKNEYESPLAFASDVRLTFQNAMVYNGKGSDVFVMAERLLLQFEDMFNQTHQKFVGNRAKKQNPCANVPILVEKPVSNVAPQVVVLSGSSKGVVDKKPKQPEMTAEEKSEMAASLLNLQLGPEGMDQIMGIVRKGVLGLEQEVDEIELDLGVLDNETLWELHKFIGGSRMKGMVTDNCVPGAVEEEVGKRDGGEEYVDIGEEIPASHFPCVEIEKDGVKVGNSNGSSSSSSSSSSSGSDSSSSDSSSGDEEEAKGGL